LLYSIEKKEGEFMNKKQISALFIMLFCVLFQLTIYNKPIDYNKKIKVICSHSAIPECGWDENRRDILIANIKKTEEIKRNIYLLNFIMMAISTSFAMRFLQSKGLDEYE
jgi:hypothetical protein